MLFFKKKCKLSNKTVDINNERIVTIHFVCLRKEAGIMSIYRVVKVSPVSEGHGDGGGIGYEGKRKKAKVSAPKRGFGRVFDSSIRADSLNSQKAVNVYNGILKL